MSQFNEADVRSLWRCARTHNSSIPDEALDAMRETLLATLRQQPTNLPEIGSKLVGDGAVSDEVVTVAPLLRAPAEQGGRVDFSEADGAALRSLKVGEVLTEGQWESACQFVRHQDDIIRNLRAALAQNAQVEAVFVYPNKPTPRAWGYLDDSGVEWAGYDVSQMEAYARAAVALHAERAQGEAVACRYRFGDGSGGWLGWRYADQPPKKAAPGDVVQVEPLYVHTEQGAKGEAAAWQHRHSGYPDEWKECTREEFEYTQKHPDCPREARELYTHAERARVPEGMVLVPREPTEEMIEAAFSSDSPGDDPSATPDYAAAYKAMLAAAPSPPAAEEVER